MMIIDKEDVRAGETRVGVRYMLWASLILAIIVMTMLLIGYI
jgi:hypothetical protein